MPSTILIVEDHHDSAQVAAMLLRRFGHIVFVARCCQEAMDIASLQKMDIVLCDIGLPDGDGAELARQFKQTQHVITVALTGSGEISNAQSARAAGFDGFLLKPITLETLKSAVTSAEKLSLAACEMARPAAGNHLALDPDSPR